MTPDEHQAAQWNAAIAQHLIRTAWPIDLQKVADDVKGWAGRGHMPSSSSCQSRGPSTFPGAGAKRNSTTRSTSASGSSDAAPLPGRSVPSETGQPASPLTGSPVVY